ncbi:amino acid permease 8-like [Diospyros lotus]|uniref:amino acid permease 8-like n=1 Tax=Diospyros lotus TaxID=55363 RepID=UPI0022535C6E|nr:amino acid permease 8-like [Diospyros lotus]
MGDGLFHLQMSDQSEIDPKNAANVEQFDDDGKPRRTGTVWTATAHVITAVIGSGVLSLAWGVAQLGWLAGVSTIFIFSLITLYTSNLLADCYRSPDPVSGERNCTYGDAVKANLGGKMFLACRAVQFAILIGMSIGYTITASISMVAIQKSNCYHMRGHEAKCNFSHNPYMIGMGILEIFLSQIPNFHKLSMLSIVAAIMSFGYSLVGIGLAFAMVVSGNGKRTTLTGVEVGMNLSTTDKTWRMFTALGDIALAFSYCQLLIEIQDTLSSAEPENKVMKKANTMAVCATSAFYMMCGCFGYAAFGNEASGNLLTGFGFYDPFWLVNLANIFIVVHLVGAYQVFVQPVYDSFESWARRRWPDSRFVTANYSIVIGKKKKKKLKLDTNLLRLTWRTGFVTLATMTAMAMPFFNDILGLLGAVAYWPLTVFFPVAMFVSQKKIRRWSRRWIGLQLINMVCFLVALAAACGSIQGLNKALHAYKPFNVKD